MRIISFNQGHDISIVCLEEGKLIFSHEAEKDNGERNSPNLTPSLLIKSFQACGLPDVIAHAGWHKKSDNYHAFTDSGYFGVGKDSRVEYIENNFGSELKVLSCSHERSHIMCSYGMSGFPQGQPCYALVWEGAIGAFYYVDKDVTIHKIGDVLPEVGNKYAFLYALADPKMPEMSTYVHKSDAGKLMALAAYGKDTRATKDELETIRTIMGLPVIYGYPHKASMKKSKYFNIGLDSQKFRNLARKYSEAVFNKFYDYAQQHLDQKLPLIISGGCGLNCDWNSQWKDCGLFTDVFVPPCTNDSGVALGAAVDAQFLYTGNAKIEWNVYAGDYFLNDRESAKIDGFEESPLNVEELCKHLAGDKVFAWVQGRAEMGPRALGNRSLLASPFQPEMKEKLNKIKYREDFRPIAPVCLAEEMDKYFDNNDESPFMLYFQRVKSKALGAVTHVDGTARAQTINKTQNPQLYNLLTEFKRQTGIGVLCNTSLNFPGRGFINRLSDLAEYAKVRELDGFVVGDKMYLNRMKDYKNTFSDALSDLNKEQSPCINLKKTKETLLLSLQKRGQFYPEERKKTAGKNNTKEMAEWIYKVGDKRVPAMTVEVLSINQDQFIIRIIMPVMKGSQNKTIRDFCDNDSVIKNYLGGLYELALTKANQISLVIQQQVNFDSLQDMLSTHLKTINWTVLKLHSRLRQADLSGYVLDPHIELFWGETMDEAKENLRQTSDAVKTRERGNVKISYTDELAGGGQEFGDDYLINFVNKNIGPVERAYEWCAGPAFIGYSLLASRLCGSLCLSDINPKAVKISHKTALENNLLDGVSIYESDCLDNIPETEKWDLVVANPPFSKSDLMIPSWGKEIKYKDLNFGLHRRFFDGIGKYLKPGANIILLESFLCSSADDFLPMINKAGLCLKKVIRHDKDPMIYAMWITCNAN